MTTFVAANPILTLAGAEAAVAAARAEAHRRGLAVTIAALDRGGHVVLLLRMDGIHVGTTTVATAKAKTTVLYNRSTADLGAAVAGGNMALLSLPDLLALGGGLPLKSNDVLVGAIGVSGSSPDVDHAIALAGAEAFHSGIGQ